LGWANVLLDDLGSDLVGEVGKPFPAQDEATNITVSMDSMNNWPYTMSQLPLSDGQVSVRFFGLECEVNVVV
jgi:hypothetical protein